MLLSVGQSLSSVLGWISIACWIVVYSPQLYENYSLESGEGVSVLFVLIWLAGDILNLAGALLAGLLPTIIILAGYYTTCDLLLLAQIYYYRWKHSRIGGQRGEPQEQTPLIAGDAADDRHTTTPVRVIVLRYTCALLFVIAVGIGAWWLSEGANELGSKEPPETRNSWLVQFFGWSSAALFLGARIPQILKNCKTRCEGLSPALFFFSILGNTTYALSICAKSMDKQYLLTNAGWLAGSGLTVFLDIFVLCQFIYYRRTEDERRME
ncbi:PQ-loop-domain-containing protein [Coprinopsis marcescibilis]|uniref:PQ-loop-domain-containing protein n=1 Tax=Coprinopsis marcescibilis TaxID=230819 RepID=A0A5C3L7L2_COPMA|nr:PQ-loop-domain-containing protein [Coprinopsis marcescibilis]